VHEEGAEYIVTKHGKPGRIEVDAPLDDVFEDIEEHPGYSN
jgi:hypothetical protein